MMSCGRIMSNSIGWYPNVVHTRGMATKKAVGSTKNGRDSAPKYLGGNEGEGNSKSFMLSFTLCVCVQ